jgi:hypothetical protein
MGLLRAASQRSGLTVRHGVPECTLQGARYDRALARAAARDYPRALQQIDAVLYSKLGLAGGTDDASHSPRSTVWYDPAARSLLLRRAAIPQRALVINELARALVDQHFNLKRLNGLRSRDRDRALAAAGIVNGTAALASGVSATGAGARRLHVSCNSTPGPKVDARWRRSCDISAVHAHLQLHCERFRKRRNSSCTSTSFSSVNAQ